MRNRPYGFEIYLVNVKTIAQICVAFSEKLNFTIQEIVLSGDPLYLESGQTKVMEI